jgi:hypothetical protein
LLFDTLNQIIGNTQLPEGMPGAILALSSNGGQQGTGILWTSHPINGDANHSVVPGILQAYDATNVTHELWNSNMNGKRDSIGKLAKFVVPTIANGKVYMATFSNKLNVYGLNPPPASSCPFTLPGRWVSADVGYVAFPGDVCDSSGTFTVTASGNDIWGAVDAFHYVYQPVAGNKVEIMARVVSVQNTDPWAKAGVMFRSSFDAGAPNVFMAITPGNGGTFQNRSLQNNGTLNTAQGSMVAPYWVKIVSSGNKYVGYISPDGTIWTAVDSATIALGTNAYVGIAYTTHDNTRLGTALIDNVSIISDGVLSIGILNFNVQNIGNKYALLQWAATNDEAIDHVNIERSSSISDFVPIGSVNGQSDSTLIQNYSFNDNNPLEGINYYRLKQFDPNGNFQYSKIIPVTFSLSLVDIFPNPAHNQLFLLNNSNFSGNQNITIQILDESGAVVLKQISASIGNNIIPINLPVIANGVYVVKVINFKGQIQARKIMVNN